MWATQIRYEWWSEAIKSTCGYLDWKYRKAVQLKDQYIEDQRDMMGAYCAGGEL